MSVSIKLDYAAIAAVEKAVRESAQEAMQALYTDLTASETMPKDTGDMQDNQTFIDADAERVSLVTGSPQARRLYYHPEYNFQRGKNANAGALWLEPYITGQKKDFLKDQYSQILRRRLEK